MSDLLWALLICGLAGERGFAEWLHARERRYLINAAIADNPTELRQLETKVKAVRKEKPLPDGFEGQIGI